MSRLLTEDQTRTYGWALIVVLKLVVVVGFHLWSVENGRRGLAPIVLGGDDGDLYLPFAERVADTGTLPPFIPNVWPIVVGRLMEVTGLRGVLPFKVLLFAASFITAWLGVRLLRMLVTDTLRWSTPAGAEVLLAGLLVLFPSTLFVASYSIYRDAVIFFLGMSCAYLAYRGLIRRERAFLVALVPMLYALFEFRWYATVAIAVGILLWLPFTGGIRKSVSWKVVGLVAVGVVAAVAVALGVLTRLESIVQFRDYFDATGAQSNIGVSYAGSSVWLWPFLFVYSFVTNLIGPLPNQITSVNTLVGFLVETPVLTLVLWRVWASPIRRRPEALLLLAISVMWFVLIAIYNDNVGTALRLRVLGYQFLFIIAIAESVRRAGLRKGAHRRLRRAAAPVP